MPAAAALQPTRHPTSQRVSPVAFALSSRAILYFVYYSILLAPLGWITVNGIYARQVLLMGGAINLGLIFFNGLLPRMATNLSLFFFVGLFVLFTAFFPQVESYSWKDIVASMIYAMTAGTIFGTVREKHSENSLVVALVLMAAFTTFVAILMVRSAGGAGMLRSETEEQIEGSGILFGGLMGDRNVIIGVIPMTALALSFLPFIVLQPFQWINLILAPTVAAAIYVNVSVASRTALGTAVIIGTAFLIYSIRHGSKRGRYSVSIIFSVALLFVAASFLLPSVEQFVSPLLHRFTKVAEDSRLDLWSEAIDLLIRNPFGNGIQQFTQHKWAHNFFLDVGLNAGVPAIVIVAGYHVLALLSCWHLHQMKLLDPSTPESIFVLFGMSILIGEQVQVPSMMFVSVFVMLCAYERSLVTRPGFNRTIKRGARFRIHADLRPRRSLTDRRIPTA